MNMKHIFTAAGLAFSLLFAGAPASANTMVTCGTGPSQLLNYSFDMDYDVTGIAKYNEFLPDCGNGISNSDTAPVGHSVVTDIFAKHDPVGRSLLLGLTQNLPGDAEGQQHLVLFTNNAFAASATNIAFGTLFPTTLEASLIAALNSLNSGTGSESDYALLFDFSSNAAQNGPNGDAAFLFGSDFTAIAFSTGQIIGTGTSYYSVPPITDPVPEPATWAMMIIGFGAVGGAMRRRTAAVRLRLA